MAGRCLKWHRNFGAKDKPLVVGDSFKMNVKRADVVAAVLIIIALASYLGVRRIANIEPASVFRT